MDTRIDDRGWLASRYAEGASLADIAAELGVHRNTVRNRFNQFGIDRRPPGEAIRGRPVPASRRAKMSAARTAYWATNPMTDELRTKISKSRRRTGTNQGYPTVYIPGRGSVREHRLVVEQAIGRELDSSEVVHHRDGSKTNNSVKNLELTNQSDHLKTHRATDPKLSDKTFRTSTHKQCRKCHEVKPRTAFSPCTTPGRDHHATRCKSCCAADAKSRRAT